MKKNAKWLIVYSLCFAFVFLPVAVKGDVVPAQAVVPAEFAETVEAENAPVQKAVVHNPNPRDRLHLRQSPTSEGKSLGRYYNGTEVAVLSYPSQDWAQVRIGQKQGYLEGYMMVKFISFEQNAVDSAKPLVTTTVKNLNLRSNPSKGASSIALYDQGIQVEVMGFTSAWYHVKTPDGKTGFMMAEFLTPKLEDVLPEDQSVDYVVEYAVVNNPNPQDRLHLRQSPNREANSLGKYYNGVQALVLEKRKDGWARVKIGSLEGYMDSQYLAFNIPQANIPSAMPTVTVTVEGYTGKTLNLRAGQSQKTMAIAQYPSGTQVEVWGLTPIWYHVRTQDGQIGFMMAEFLTPNLTY